MSDPYIDQRRRLRHASPQVLLSYNNWRSTHCTATMVCVVEGNDDVTFYETQGRRVRGQVTWATFVAKGKQQVLELREALKRNQTPHPEKRGYCIDHDFDGTKGAPSGPDLFVTPAYSIENLLVNQTSLTALLRNEFRCHDEHGPSDIERVGRLFEARLAEFFSVMRLANQMLHAARTQGITIANCEKNFEKVIHITLERVQAGMAQADIPNRMAQLVGWTSPPDDTILGPSADAFAKLDPLLEWRGKFLFDFFRKFLARLKEDRGSKTPQYFSAKGSGIGFDPAGDMIANLAGKIDLVTGIDEFFHWLAAPPSSAPIPQDPHLPPHG